MCTYAGKSTNNASATATFNLVSGQRSIKSQLASKVCTYGLKIPLTALATTEVTLHGRKAIESIKVLVSKRIVSDSHAFVGIAVWVRVDRYRVIHTHKHLVLPTETWCAGSLHACLQAPYMPAYKHLTCLPTGTLHACLQAPYMPAYRHLTCLPTSIG